MKAVFSLEYHTKWGENLFLVHRDVFYPMLYTEGGVWTAEIKDCPSSLPGDYRYAVMENGLVTRTEWTSHHRELPGQETSPSAGRGRRTAVFEDSWIDCPDKGCPFPVKHSAPMFDTPAFRAAGTAVPVFSLRSEEGFGTGEFNDLYPLIDWAVATGQKIIQLLPVNDTSRQGGWGDSYPYSPVSSFALHPLYLNLREAGVEEDEEFLREKDRLNSFGFVNYPEVIASKMRFLRRTYSARGNRASGTEEYGEFLDRNGYWLTPYAEYRAAKEGVKADFFRWIQFELDRQFTAVASYARSRGVCLKGDLPIGVGADSVDALSFPHLFNLDSQAGAPPDYFSADGQNWGFPTYNWEEMEKDGYAWWKSRLRKMSQWFDAYRIDHILGFFRIWEIPRPMKSGKYGHFNPALPYSREEIEAMGLPVEGLFVEDPRRKGMLHPLISPDTSSLTASQKEKFNALYTDFFYHRHDGFWKTNALKKLPHLLTCTGMLACGEDLGMIPDCVGEVMDSWKILSLEMERMDKGRGWPYLSVCTTSTHDMEPLRTSRGGDLPAEECLQAVERHLGSPSMLCILPLQDWLSIDGKIRRDAPSEERINDPANPDNHWCWRMHITVRKLLENTAFSSLAASLVKNSGR